jgi:hypothetical protein
MAKPTKNVITKEAVLESMREGNRAALPYILIPFIITSLVLLTPAFFLFRYLILATAPPLLRIALGLGAAIPLCGPSIYFFVRICIHFSERRMLKNGQVVWEKLPLLEKHEKLVHRHTEPTFRFHGLWDVCVSSTAYRLVDRGDEYYILHFKGKKTVRRLYAVETHELRDE